MIIGCRTINGPTIGSVGIRVLHCALTSLVELVASILTVSDVEIASKRLSIFLSLASHGA